MAQRQKEILNKIKLEVIRYHKTQKEKIEKINNEIVTLLKGNEIDKEKLANLINEKKDLWEKNHEKMCDLITNKIIEFHKILKPEQKEKLAEMFKKHLKSELLDWRGFLLLFISCKLILVSFRFCLNVLFKVMH